MPYLVNWMKQQRKWYKASYFRSAQLKFEIKPLYFDSNSRKYIVEKTACNSWCLVTENNKGFMNKEHINSIAKAFIIIFPSWQGFSCQRTEVIVSTVHIWQHSADSEEVSYARLFV